MPMHSYHIFYFPFKWEVKGRENMLFAEQTNLDNIRWNPLSNWVENPEVTKEKEQQELYNEQNYYYEFVHPVLYDTGKENSILKHFERREPQNHDVSYIISKHGGKTYTLKVDAINLNLYETGVGMLSFFLKNEQDDQKEQEDILTINQYGRRIFPPFYDDIEGKYETAEFLAINGLNGNPERYREDFKSWLKHGKLDKKAWSSACFVTNLILDLCDGFEITPVIDDRMFVNCWYSNNELADKYRNCNKESLDVFFQENDFWYKYVYVDVSSETCKNDEMKKDLLNKQTYKRWQKDGTIFGMSRYSFVVLTCKGFYGNLLKVHMPTIYSRMIELILIQRSSILRFSDEVSKVGQLSKVKDIDKRLIDKISSIYREYIRFTNQIYFREVTAQDQGIELYKLMSDTLNLRDYVEGLDKEINELYQYVSLVDDRIRNENSSYLNKIATIFFPATLIAGLFGMNTISNFNGGDGEIVLSHFLIQIVFIGAICSLFYQLIKKK